MIPCKTHKCILFPACKNKKQIHCHLLRKHIEEICIETGILSIEYAWDVLQKDFPNLYAITADGMKKIKSLASELRWCEKYYRDHYTKRLRL